MQDTTTELVTPLDAAVSRKALLLAAYDAVIAVRASLDVHATSEPLAEETLRLWAAAHAVEVKEHTYHNTDNSFTTYEVTTAYDRRITVYGVPKEHPVQKLRDYRTGDAIRNATREEIEESDAAAERDGGHGIIVVNNRSCYVEA